MVIPRFFSQIAIESHRLSFEELEINGVRLHCAETIRKLDSRVVCLEYIVEGGCHTPTCGISKLVTFVIVIERFDQGRNCNWIADATQSIGCRVSHHWVWIRFHDLNEWLNGTCVANVVQQPADFHPDHPFGVIKSRQKQGNCCQRVDMKYCRHLSYKYTQ